MEIMKRSIEWFLVFFLISFLATGCGDEIYYDYQSQAQGGQEVEDGRPSQAVKFRLRGDSPDRPKIVLSSSAGNLVMRFKCIIGDEDVWLRYIHFFENYYSWDISSIERIEVYFRDKDNQRIFFGSSEFLYFGNWQGDWYVYNEADFYEVGDTFSKGEVVEFEVEIALAGIGTSGNDLARSGDRLQLILEKVVVEGADSGEILATSIIGVESEDIYVFSSKIIASKSSSQPAALHYGWNQVLNFTLLPSSNEGDDPDFYGIFDVEVDSFGGAIASGVRLYDGAGNLLGENLDLSQGMNVDLSNSPDVISGNGETYVLEVYVEGSLSEGSAVFINLPVNNGPDQDAIRWSDGSYNGGPVDWIDLGETTTMGISNHLIY